MSRELAHKLKRVQMQILRKVDAADNMSGHARLHLAKLSVIDHLGDYAVIFQNLQFVNGGFEAQRAAVECQRAFVLEVRIQSEGGLQVFVKSCTLLSPAS